VNARNVSCKTCEHSFASACICANRQLVGDHRAFIGECIGRKQLQRGTVAMPFIRGSKERDTSPHAIRCSFCRKGKDDVAKMISGPGVYICDQCVELCNKILKEASAPQS